MNTMNMPGYTAQASLYRTRRRYEMAGTVIRAGESQESVLPALPKWDQPLGKCNAFSVLGNDGIAGGYYQGNGDGTYSCCELRGSPGGPVEVFCISCQWPTNACVDAKPVRPPLIFTAPPVGGVFQR